MGSTISCVASGLPFQMYNALSARNMQIGAWCLHDAIYYILEATTRLHLMNMLAISATELVEPCVQVSFHNYMGVS